MTDPAPTNRWLAASSDADSRAEGYDANWERLAATGADIHGEASFVERLGPTSVLDAGCGTGRVAIELARRGVDVVGVDLDPGMLEVARRKVPDLRWVEGDLATVELGRQFDVVVAAGNVLIFLAPGTEAAVVTNLARHLTPEGMLVAGFQLSEDRLPLAVYDDHCRAAGLVTVERYATWERAPYDGGDYAVSVGTRAGRSVAAAGHARRRVGAGGHDQGVERHHDDGPGQGTHPGQQAPGLREGIHADEEGDAGAAEHAPGEADHGGQ